MCNPAQTTCLDTTVVKSEDRYKKFVPKQRVCDLHNKFCETLPGVINDAKRKAWHAIYTAKRNAEKEKFAGIKGNKENIFHFPKQMHTENQDAMAEKCIRSGDGNLYLDEASKKLTWKQRYERLLNI